SNARLTAFRRHFVAEKIVAKEIPGGVAAYTAGNPDGFRPDSREPGHSFVLRSNSEKNCKPRRDHELSAAGVCLLEQRTQMNRPGLASVYGPPWPTMRLLNLSQFEVLTIVVSSQRRARMESTSPTPGSRSRRQPPPVSIPDDRASKLVSKMKSAV